MFQQMLRRFGVPAMVAAVFAMAGPAWAQHHGGGGHGGGFHGGSPHADGFHFGGMHPGGFHSNGFHGGRFRHGGYFPGFYYGYDAPYGYYPSYGYYSPYSSYPSYGLGYGADSAPGYPDSSGGVAPSYPSGYLTLEPPSTVRPTTAAQADSTVHVTVSVPANAELWVDGSKTTSTGSVREFLSPPLTPGQYAYEIRAHWTEDGHDFTQTQKVAVSPGAHIAVNFPIGPRPTQAQG
jgi:uncharacterized protein (TIGR03000 family)